MIYLAGNFPLLNDLGKERDFKSMLEKGGIEYRRLTSFFYPKTCNNVLTLKREEKDGGGKEKRKTSARLRDRHKKR